MKEKKKKIINFGILTIKVKLNNVFLTLSNYETGEVLIYKSSGSLGYKGLKKKTSYVVLETLSALFEELLNKPYLIKLLIVDIRCFWFDWSIDNIWNVFEEHNINNLFYINYNFIRSHNGVRGKKKRRL